MKGRAAMINDTMRNVKVNIKYCINLVKYWPKFAGKYDYTDFRQKNEELPIRNIVTWNKAFKRFIISQPHEVAVMEDFFGAKLKIVKPIHMDNNVIMISVVKNELYRSKKFLEHYRKMGVHQFVIIDNQSTDGTYDYLLSQKDVFLISALEKYTTNRREAWINRVFSYFGFNRWYMVADIDELITYKGIEQHSIKDVLKFAETHQISRIRGMMLDMYPSEYDLCNELEDKYNQYVYFDSNTYTYEKACELEIVRGGFRKRCMGTNALLTKYPVFYFEEGDIEGKSHFLFPYSKNWGDCYLAIKHYKFLPSDFEKYRKIAKSGNYYNGSEQYKQYIRRFDDKDNPIKLLYSGTVKYIDSSSLDNLRCLKEMKWEEA